MERARPGPERPTDRELLRRVASDPDALEAFYRRHIAEVTRFAARRCGSAQDLADVVSQTFVRAIVGSPSFRARRSRDGSARPWLLRITLNEIRDRYYVERRQRAVFDLQASRRLLDDDDVADLDRCIDSTRASATLVRALEQLSPAEREVIQVVALDQLTTKEAAVVLGISEVAVRARLSRGRRRLRRALDRAEQPGTARVATSR